MSLFTTHTKHLTGIVPHVASWLFSRDKDIELKNPNYKPSEIDGQDVTIYCIPGTADKGVTAFKHMTAYWLPNIPSNVSSIQIVAFPEKERNTTIPEFAMQLRDKIVAKQHKNIILVGHSRGGLINAYLALFLAEGLNILGLVSICTPFKGTYLASPPFSTIWASVRQMKKGCLFLEQLNDEIRQSKIKFFYYGAGDDSVVNHKNCYGVEEHKEFVTIIPNHGHISVARSKDLAMKISVQLDVLSQIFLLNEQKVKEAEEREIYRPCIALNL